VPQHLSHHRINIGIRTTTESPTPRQSNWPTAAINFSPAAPGPAVIFLDGDQL
jgi:hypothetical protein